jgi:hypothetical protein
VTTTRADAGTGMELDVIAAVVLGGTNIMGGSGSILGTTLGLLIIAMLRNGLSLAGIKGDATVVIIGWYSWPSLVNSFDIGEYSSDPGGLIRWPVRLLIPVAFGLLGLQGISEIVKRAAFLKGLLPASEFEKRGHAT